MDAVPGAWDRTLIVLRETPYGHDGESPIVHIQPAERRRMSSRTAARPALAVQARL